MKSLKVNKGIEKPANVNRAYQVRRKKKRRLEDYISGIRSGDIAVLSQAVTMAESRLDEDADLAQGIIDACLPYSGKSFRIGITGLPGAGKSTFIEALGMYLIEKKKKKVAVLAIDPSGSKSGGSILGDKTRMERLSTNPSAYIRPSASAGTLGGVARKTAESIILCEAAGFDVIFVETVGVGQSEIAVKSMTDFFLMLQIAGAGDELQGIKRGITEAADAIVINKADGNNIINAETARQNFKNALHLFPARKYTPEPEVFIASAYTQLGITDVWQFIETFMSFISKNGFFEKNRNEQALNRMLENINENLYQHFSKNEDVIMRKKILEQKVISGELSPYKAAQELLDIYFKD